MYDWVTRRTSAQIIYANDIGTQEGRSTADFNLGQGMQSVAGGTQQTSFIMK
jgi:hypothetical protein